MTAKYRVYIESNKAWSRIIVAPTSFDARRIVAAAFNRPVTDFYAIRVQS